MTECRNNQLNDDICSVLTVLSCLRTVMMLLPHIIKSARFESLASYNKWHLGDRNVSFAHYLFVEPLFLSFVVWGERTLDSDMVSTIACTVKLLWLLVMFMIICTLFVSCMMSMHYKQLVSTFRAMEFVCVIAFLVDAINSPKALPIIMILLKLFSQTIFVIDLRNHMSVTIALGQIASRSLSAPDSAASHIAYLDDEDSANVNSLERKTQNLFYAIEQINPDILTLSQLREFIEDCKSKTHDVVSMSLSEPTSSRSELSGSDTSSGIVHRNSNKRQEE